jgi:hypothetical protein
LALQYRSDEVRRESKKFKILGIIACAGIEG